ncbi:hypothetical protein J5N97_025417 [Dioscorea zingiberensis]|uniref:Cytochrome P450 n=1 Tax=Dioscorea zingiberensis TaxID=325984 RepID=A0A9D5C9S6_9LILI|nr:hypothetical protein J5N97_025417 [Dioscorea zingiberensis]
MSEVSHAWSWYQIGESQRMALTFFFFLLSTIIFILHRKSEKTKGMPPGPRGLPLVGYLPFLRPDLHSCFADLAKIFGPVMMMKLGSRQCLILSSPEAAKEVLRDHDATFANHDMTVAVSIITFGGQDMAFQPYGPLWRALRKACVRELLNAQTLDSFRTLRQQEVILMAKELHRRAGKPVAVGQMVFVTSFNVITSMLWGNSLVADELERIRGEFRELEVGIIDLMGVTNVSDIFPILERMDLQGVQRKMKQHKEKLDGILRTVIDRRERTMNTCGDQEKAQDFLQVMLELVKKEDPLEHLTVDNIKGLFTNIILAGTDTTSTTIEWAMAEMIDKPETIRKAKEELDSVVGKDEIVDESHLPKLHYLEALVKETLRLHPATPLLLARYPTATCNIAGYTIPKGTKVFINVWSIHRDPAVWENPLEFKPERFLTEMSKCDYYGNNFNFIPFGSGRRICVGIPLVEKMSLYILATMLHCFDWSLPDGMKLDLVEKFGIVLKMEKQLVAIPTARPSCAKLHE